MTNVAELPKPRGRSLPNEAGEDLSHPSQRAHVPGIPCKAGKDGRLKQGNQPKQPLSRLVPAVRRTSRIGSVAIDMSLAIRDRYHIAVNTQ